MCINLSCMIFTPHCTSLCLRTSPEFGSMRTYSLCFVLVYMCLILSSAPDRANNWTDVVIAQEGRPVTLPCSDGPATVAEQVTWMMMRPEEKHWTLLLSVNSSRRPVDRLLSSTHGRTFEIFEDVSLQFIATATDGGRYSCLMQQRGRKLKEKIILLALLKLTLAPAPPIPLGSTVRLTAQVSPYYAVAGGMWLSPAGVPLLTVVPAQGTLLTKLPRVNRGDNGLYICSIHVQGQSSKPEYKHTLNVTVNAWEAAKFPNIKYDSTGSKASLSNLPVTLPCPPVSGDYVQLYWWKPNLYMSNPEPELVFQFDRWRNHMKQNRSNFQLLGPSSVEAKGNFSFLLRPKLGDAGRYQCEVFLDSAVFGQSTTLTVLHVSNKTSSSTLDLICKYAERSQVKRAKWTHVERPDVQLPMKAMLGMLTVSVSLPVTPETAGQYICTLLLENSQTLNYTYTVTLPPPERPCCVSQRPTSTTTDSTGFLLTPAEGSSVPQPSALLPSLSLLLFLMPVIAVAVGVLLWRRGRCSLRRNVDVEHTLSHYSGEVENIYENPEDLRQSPLHGVYMDLKPTGETDVYRELDRYDPCCD
ncbi:g6f-like isoform X1 [Pygocentrus nattereri]|uniref:Ig-like domain-containing protein n=1 Tax=Pygocentrus nattereri TaxID=42514 RepID=A0A3B4CU13_PYGNA|nr:g6f-like isoform X1 [Pygocentrus nattereri]